MKNQTNSMSNRAAREEKVKELLEQLEQDTRYRFDTEIRRIYNMTKAEKNYRRDHIHKDSDELALNYSLKRGT